jgi:hypothetical protein
MKKSQIDKFEEQLRKHCNIEKGVDGDDIIRSSVNSVLIAFEEWYKGNINNKIININLSKEDLPPELKKIVDDNFWDLF